MSNILLLQRHFIPKGVQSSTLDYNARPPARQLNNHRNIKPNTLPRAHVPHFIHLSSSTPCLMQIQLSLKCRPTSGVKEVWDNDKRKPSVFDFLRINQF